MRPFRRLSDRVTRLRPPRRTVRLRLTLLYAGLFLICGAGLLGITYVLVSRATDGAFTYQGKDGNIGTVVGSPRENGPAPSGQSSQGEGNTTGVRDVDGAQAEAEARQAELLARQQRAEQLRQLLTQSGIALGIMTVISIGLGWIVAGRILHRLRTITAAARDISATNLHERLALDGPHDELKELGDTFDQLLARLEGSFQAQRQFIANASHELRTPLARQRTVAQVALADPDATVETLRAAHERVLAAGAQQERLIAALLTLARGQAGLNWREPLDLARLAEEVLTARREEAAHRNVGFHPALSPARTTGDPRLAERLIVNLVENAMRYNVTGGRIEVTTATLRGSAVLSVVNTGPVVPADAVERLFQPFDRLGAERTSRGEGLGLGLSIVRAIADAHDAVVETRPRPEGGLEVTVTFQALDVPAEGGQRVPPTRSIPANGNGRIRAETTARPHP
ncbi:HAMP domain-containing sensor histidine kinase [Actinomadura viridis]|uniref:histidine kinase n=1 Tax=Actinomadura viridis TaxID=58110 RepID=A0A931GK06_9ACTN|nr:HAMP domain-containing sensor histidine kinase [Actinomadura viridis]MBG6085896.1 signal transduction histidine kinase [Actinomadura viridis]